MAGQGPRNLNGVARAAALLGNEAAGGLSLPVSEPQPAQTPAVVGNLLICFFSTKKYDRLDEGNINIGLNGFFPISLQFRILSYMIPKNIRKKTHITISTLQSVCLVYTVHCRVKIVMWVFFLIFFGPM